MYISIINKLTVEYYNILSFVVKHARIKKKNAKNTNELNKQNIYISILPPTFFLFSLISIGKIQRIFTNITTPVSFL